jgi:hypothetical protein
MAARSGAAGFLSRQGDNGRTPGGCSEVHGHLGVRDEVVDQPVEERREVP